MAEALQFLLGSGRVRLSNPCLPESFGVAIELGDFLLMAGIGKFNACDAFEGPIVKELGGSFADAARCALGFDVERTCRSEAEGVRQAGDCADQEPSALIKV